MIQSMDGRLSIGEFATRSGLSAKVLRTYADVGLLAPSAVDPATGYRYYDAAQLDDASIVLLLRRAGVPVADIAEFLGQPRPDSLDAWELSLRAEADTRRDALAEVRTRLGLTKARTRGITIVDVRPVEDPDELRRLFDCLGAELVPPIDSADYRFTDVESHFPHDRPLMLVATVDGRPAGGALAFRTDEASVTLRIIAVPQPFRHRGIGRRLVERVESEARMMGVDRIGLGTAEAVGFWFHLGYTPNLLLQWVYDAAAYETEAEALLAGPLHGRRHWRSSFNDVPQLFVELDEPRLDLLATVREAVEGCHVGFMMSKRLRPAPA